jgi:MFS family permease
VILYNRETFDSGSHPRGGAIPTTTHAADSAYPQARRAWYAVAVLAIAYIFSFIDRQILSLLVAPIRRDLHISDTQMSLLMGISFALFYCLFGFPIGRMADSRSRRNIITAGVFTWSLFTAGCGLAATYLQMFVMRVGVGVGEAALSPPAYSLMADLFPPKRRALALSVYGMGMFIGAGLALVVGGIIVARTSGGGVITLPLIGISIFPWQLTFFIVGLPGFFIAALVRTVREPVRKETQSASATPVSAVVAYIKDHRATFAYYHVATAMLSFAYYGASAWIPSFLMRTYGWKAGRAGLVFGLVVTVFSSLGILCGGLFCQTLARRGYRDAHFRVGLTVALVILPIGVLYPLMPLPWLAVALLVPYAFLSTMIFGVAPAALQVVVANEMRAQVSAMYLFVVNIIGLGLGPTIIALLTDRVFHNDNMLRYSLVIAATGAYLVSALLWWLGLKPFRRTVDHAEAARQPMEEVGV